MYIRYLSLILFLFISTPAWATTWYIRSDGGTDTQCTGTTDAAYPGSGTGQACAFSHPYYATGWYYDGSGNTRGTMHVLTGDTVSFSKSGDSFKMGYDATWTSCNAASYPYECYPRPWPSGTSGNHTEIQGYSAGTKTILWGTRGTSPINISSNDYIDISNLELTDHKQCEKGGTNPPTSCGLTDDYGSDGIAGKGNDNITITDVYIHGMARYAIQAPGASNWTYTRLVTKNNGYGGLSFDDGTGSGVAVTGNMTMSHSSITYSGCGETYPGLATADCWGQSDTRGGYGDGIAFGNGTIGNWTITDSSLSLNTQDGFDGKHGVHTGDWLHSARNLYMGNGGQQLKMESPLTSENDMFIGECNYFDGQSFTASGFGPSQGGSSSDLCRALGNTLEIGVSADEVHKITGATIYGIGDVTILVSGSSTTCNGGTSITLKNSVVLNGRQWGDDTAINPSGGNDTSALFYSAASGACASVTLTEDYNQIYGTKAGSSDVSGAHSRYGDPIFSGTINRGPTTYSKSATLDQNFYLSSTSPLRYSVTGANTADESLTSGEVSDLTIDFNSYSRGANWDGGALQYGSTASSAVCGNGITESGEQCDDGNTTAGDGCSATCTTENPVAVAPFKGALSGKGLITGKGLFN